ncbi:MAG TPA: hypothetical protein VE994_16275 [Terriglobales bacterium]|nr:hypothetical protein [Terriglobales bacterium]
MKKQLQTAVEVKLWVYNPALDLIVGCGAWSAPLLALAYFGTLSSTMVWAVALYVLALFFNYPHYMATIYRAYHTSEDFNKYRIFTVHITGLMVATALVCHLFPTALPWIFTLYLIWSPWHYSGQNYGLFMMFARRAGAKPSTGQRQALYAAFILSYLMFFVSLYSGPSNDPLFISLALPEHMARFASAMVGIAFTVTAAYGVSGLLGQLGVRKFMPALTLLSTQCLWFLLPTFFWLAEGWKLPAVRYSTGVLAIMHSAQYLWITSYYAQREASSANGRNWRPFAYFAVLVAGGIALFLPGPWVASYIFHYDFTTSFLIFTALVNIHHFILDGAIWKLRDGRIASLLLNSRQRISDAATGSGDRFSKRLRWFGGSTPTARAVRISFAVALLLLGGLDRFRFLLSTGEGHLAWAERAAALNPYDGTAEMRLAHSELKAGHPDPAVAAWKRAMSARPFDPVPRNALLQYLTDTERFQEAYDVARVAVQKTPRDADLLTNYGILAGKLGHADQALDSLRRALRLDRHQGVAHLYIAQTLDRQTKYDDAIPEYAMFLDQVAHSGLEKRPPAKEVVAIILQLADCQAHANRENDANRSFNLAARIALQSGDKKLQSLVDVHQAEYDVSHGDLKNAMQLYQQALRLDSQAADFRSAAVDWYNYGLLLRRAHYAERFVYASLWKADSLLQSSPTAPEAKLVAAELQHTRAGQGEHAAVVPAALRNPDAVLEEALNLK